MTIKFLQNLIEKVKSFTLVFGLWVLEKEQN